MAATSELPSNRATKSGAEEPHPSVPADVVIITATASVVIKTGVVMTTTTAVVVIITVTARVVIATGVVMTTATADVVISTATASVVITTCHHDNSHSRRHKYSYSKYRHNNSCNRCRRGNNYRRRRHKHSCRFLGMDMAVGHARLAVVTNLY